MSVEIEFTASNPCNRFEKVGNHYIWKTYLCSLSRYPRIDTRHRERARRRLETRVIELSGVRGRFVYHPRLGLKLGGRGENRRLMALPIIDLESKSDGHDDGAATTCAPSKMCVTIFVHRSLAPRSPAWAWRASDNHFDDDDVGVCSRTARPVTTTIII